MPSKARIVTPLLTTAAAVVITAIMIAAALTSPTLAQDAAPTGVSTAAGDQAGHAVVHWRNAGAAFYRIGWVSLADINAVRSESRPWLDAFAFQDVSNYGQSQHLVKGLTPDTRYAFIVGAVNRRFGGAAWSNWTYLTTPSDTSYPAPRNGEPTPAPAITPASPQDSGR